MPANALMPTCALVFIGGADTKIFLHAHPLAPLEGWWVGWRMAGVLYVVVKISSGVLGSGGGGESQLLRMS